MARNHLGGIFREAVPLVRLIQLGAPLAVIALNNAANRKVFVEFGPMKTKGRYFEGQIPATDSADVHRFRFCMIDAPAHRMLR